MNINIDEHSIKEDKRIDFKYSGDFENINTDIVKALASKFIHEFPNHNNMVRNVTILRTILRQGAEANFILCRQEKGFQEVVKYDEGKLYSYEKTIEPENQAYRFFKYKYYFGDIDISIKKAHNDDQIDYSDINDIIEDSEEQIDRLKDAEGYTMPKDGKVLTELYRNFYGKNPKYTDKFIYHEMYLMMAVLHDHASSWMEKYASFITDSNGMPYSVHLTDLLLDMFPFDYVYKTDAKLDDKLKKKTIELGSLTRNLIDENNLKESIINLEREFWQNIRFDYSFDAAAKILKKLSKNR